MTNVSRGKLMRSDGAIILLCTQVGILTDSLLTRLIALLIAILAAVELCKYLASYFQ